MSVVINYYIYDCIVYQSMLDLYKEIEIQIYKERKIKQFTSPTKGCIIMSLNIINKIKNVID